MEAELKLRLTGTRDALQHNSRLRNPLDPYTRALKVVAGKRKKTDDDEVKIAQIEVRGSMYETEDGKIGWPVANVWRSIYDASKKWKLGESVKRALQYDPVVAQVLIDGKACDCDSYTAGNEAARMLWLPAKVGRQLVMRARPRIPKGWTTEVAFILDTEELQLDDLLPVFDYAGRRVGLGDWRPIYGRYSLKVI